MEIALTVIARATGARADVVVRSDAGRPAAAVLDDLRQAVGVRDSVPVTVDGNVVDPQAPLNACRLRDGAVAVVGLAGAADATTSRPQTGGEDPPLLAVVEGPAAGRSWSLREGRVVVGRDAGCDVRLDDPAASRRAARVEVTGGVITAGDVDGSCSDVLVPGGELRVGDTVLRLLTPARQSLTVVPGRDTTAIVHRPPRLPTASPPARVTFPARPTPPPRPRLALLPALAPLAGGVLLAAVLHRWEFLLFTALSPVVVVAQAASDRWAARRTTREARAAFDLRLAVATAALRDALRDETAARRGAAPDLATLALAARARSRPLWTRGGSDADALLLRVGRATLPATTGVEGDSAPPPPVVTEVPACVDLRRHRVVGVAGDRAIAAGVVRALVVQAVTLVPPGDLSVVVVAPRRHEAWGWTRWLPHVRPRRGQPAAALVAFDDPDADSRLAELAAGQSGGVTLLVVDGTPQLRESKAFTAALSAAGDQLSVLWLAERSADLPSACDAVVTADEAAGRLRLFRDDEPEVADIVPDLVDPAVAESVSRALAPLRASAAEDGVELPTEVRWTDVHGFDLTSIDAADALVRRWAEGPSTRVTLGVGPDGGYDVDLAADGPHALIAGTTGAGKSELLLTLVGSLVAANRPEDLSLLLVDFKGGAAFGACVELPHTVGVVTDLDGAGASRALASLGAELRRREALLAGVGAPDVATYGRIRRPADPRLARLVIVVDEFATLADELPDFVGGLVDIAQRGRSLGVHLVLATQRPQGAVSADIRANTRLRLCLAVTSESDSRDVVDVADAAGLSRATPGRAVARVGAAAPVFVQTARLGGARPSGDATVTIDPTPLLGRPRPRPAPGDDVSDLDLLVTAARAAATSLGCAPVPPPWLPPLPTRLPLAAVPDPSYLGRVPWGRLDLPARQQQPPLVLGVDDASPLLVVGGPRSGRSTAVRTLTVALARRCAPEDLHVWAIDAGHDTRSLERLPHVGAVVPATDGARVERLLEHLTAVVSQRRSGGHTVERDDGSGAADPRLLLVVDGWEALGAALGDVDAARTTERLLRLVAEGPGAGLRVIVTADRAALTGRLAAAIRDVVVLPLADRGDYALVGLPPRHVPDDLPPGRGVLVADGTVAQVAVTDDADVAAAADWPAGSRRARRFPPAPRVVALADVAAVSVDVAAGDGVTIGLGTDDGEPVAVDPETAGGALLVAGPPRSGRSTTLALLAAQRAATGPVVAVCPRRSRLRDVPGITVVSPVDEAATLAALDDLASTATVVVDDVDVLADGRVAARLETLARGARTGGPWVVVAATTDACLAAFRGVVAEVRRTRAAVVLRPASAHDGDVAGTRLPRRPAGDEPPGRGWLLLAGDAVPLQVALPDVLARTAGLRTA